MSKLSHTSTNKQQVDKINELDERVVDDFGDIYEITSTDDGFEIEFETGKKILLPVKAGDGIVVDVGEDDKSIEIHADGGGGTLYKHEITVRTDLNGETNPAKFILFSTDPTPYDRWSYVIEPDPLHKYFAYVSDKILIPEIAYVGDNGPVFHMLCAGQTFFNITLSGSISQSYANVDSSTGDGITDTVTAL